MKRLKNYLKKIIDIVRKPEMSILPGQIAFFLVLSVIPIITLLVLGSNLFSISLDSVIEFMNQTFPKDISNLLVPFISGKGFDISVGFFTLVGFYLASNGPHSIIIASNSLYGIDNSDQIKMRVKAIILTILLVVLFLFVLIVLGLSNVIFEFILGFIKINSINETIYIIFSLLKWPIAFLFIYACVKLIYTMAPDKNIASKSVTKGALFTTILWTIATAIYSYYVSNFANYSIFYGGLSNIIVLMMWVYIIAYILVIGIAINAQEYDDKTVKNG